MRGSAGWDDDLVSIHENGVVGTVSINPPPVINLFVISAKEFHGFCLGKLRESTGTVDRRHQGHARTEGEFPGRPHFSTDTNHMAGRAAVIVGFV